MASVTCKQQGSWCTFAALQVRPIVQRRVACVAAYPEQRTMPIQLGERPAVDGIPVPGTASAIVLGSGNKHPAPGWSGEAHAGEVVAATPRVHRPVRFLVCEREGFVDNQAAGPPSR